MKKIILALSIILLVVSGLFAQNEKMSFQAVIRDSNNELVAESLITAEIEIYSSTLSFELGTIQNETDQHGLLTLEIPISSVEWDKGPFSINIELSGPGVNSTITQELLHVPYAMHARTADYVLNSGIENDLYVGKEHEGGTIFWLSPNKQFGYVIDFETSVPIGELPDGEFLDYDLALILLLAYPNISFVKTGTLNYEWPDFYIIREYEIPDPHTHYAFALASTADYRRMSISQNSHQGTYEEMLLLPTCPIKKFGNWPE
jgi:hypothetical protein